ncbi:MAG: nucleotidyltransferase family protein [Defluviitaleaceae bacterium]|nr:nucleotidyltransferase family protein [Defluviitaleaceae bacterium]
MNISAIMLAAGLSRRMGEDKLLIEFEGKTLLNRAIELLDSLPCREKILVITPARLCFAIVPETVTVVQNTSPEDGQSKSLKLGLQAATADSYLFLTADQPRLTFESLKRLFGLAKENPAQIIYPTVLGKPCSPVLFPARFRQELLAQTGDTGGRAIRAAHPDSCLTFEAESPLDFIDIDSPEDLFRLNRSATI